MSRKRRAPKKILAVDPRYKSTIIPKLINSLMFDGKKTIAEKDGKKLLSIFEKAKEFREEVIKAGQDTDKPNFGRK